MNDLESNDESVDTPLVSPFPYSDNDSDDGEVLNELVECENVGMLRREKAINSFDEDDLAFQCMIGFRKSVAYFDPFLPMNIITRSFTYITDFVVLEDIGEFIQINKAEVVIGRKAHLLEDKQIPSVGVFSIWKAFGGNTRDLGSFGEETDKTMDIHQHISRISTQQLETASQITCDVVTIHTKTASQDLKTASECTTQPII
ncbi:hypothetical protein Tco_0466586 [Tanacetum coccineum]